MVTDTKPIDETEKCCSKCGETKKVDKFLVKRNICKECRNKKSKEIYNSIDTEMEKSCKTCNQTKSISLFVKNRIICTDCDNQRRREKYNTNEDVRQKLIKAATDFKHKKKLERDKIKETEIGKDNKKCRFCEVIKHKDRFRHNRLKCRDCERDDPVEKFKRYVRSRIYGALTKKVMHTIDYLGCSSSDYLNWILSNDSGYTLDNYGKVWHIDHVIPLSKFNLDNEEEQLVAFNWRNTMPLSASENLSKNNKLVLPQIEQHRDRLLEYHKNNKIEFPQKFINLFARHLVAGTPSTAFTTTPK
jgi:hypothetical protein